MIQYKPKSVKTEFGSIKVSYDMDGEEKTYSLSPTRFIKHDLKRMVLSDHFNKKVAETKTYELTEDVAKKLVFNAPEVGDFDNMAKKAGYEPLYPNTLNTTLLCKKGSKYFWWKYQENPIQIPKHRNLIEIIEYNSKFIVMPAEPHPVLRYAERVPPSRILQMAIDLLSGVSALHAVGIVHMDISAHNVIIAPDKFIIIDFDVSLQIKNFDKVASESPGIMYRMKNPDPVLHDHKSVIDMINYYAIKTIQETPSVELFKMCEGLFPVLNDLSISVDDKIVALKKLL